MKIGVIGVGTVGGPLKAALEYYHDSVVCYDVCKPSDDWQDIIRSDVCFICVPTDKGVDGRLDMCHVEDTLEHLYGDEYDGLVVVKSTLRIGYISDAIRRYDSLDIAVFPEWLRAAYAFPDTLNPEMTVLGVQNDGQCRRILDVCCWHSRDDAFVLKPEEAVMVKLTANALAATKISFANQIALLAERYGIDGGRVMEVVRADPRCAARYLYPGWPYGGYCLPKDTSELACSVDEDTLLDAVERVNMIMQRDEQGVEVEVESSIS